MAIASAARVANPVGTIEITSPRKEIAIDRDQVDFAGTINSDNLPPQISIVINDQTLQLPVAESGFREPRLQLQPGQNLVCAFLDADNWDVISVVTPREFFHFDDDDEGWSLKATGGFQPDLAHATTQENNGHLSAKNGENELDIIFLIDVSQSMDSGASDWQRFAHSILDTLRQKALAKLHVRVYSFRTEEFLLVKQFDEPSDLLREDLFSFSGGGGDLTEHLLPNLKKALNIQANPTSFRRQIIAFTDAPSKFDSVKMHSEIATLATTGRIDVHTVIAHAKLPEGENDQKTTELNEINETITDLALACGQQVARKNNGVCIEFLIPNKYMWPPGFEALAKIQALADDEEFENQLATIVSKIEDNVRDNLTDASWSWRPPNRCRESMRSAYNENIFVSLSGFEAPQLLLKGTEQTLTLELQPTSSDWNTFKIPLNDSAPWISNTGEAPNLKSVLSSLSDFEIRSSLPTESMSLDRFIITQADEIVSLPIPNDIEKETRETK